MYKVDTTIRYVKGLGPQRSRELNKLGIHTVLDLLEYKPLSYIFPGVTAIADAKDGPVVIKARIKTIKKAGHSTLTCTTATLEDDTGTCAAMWYNPHTVRILHSGMTATFYGKMSGGMLQSPKWCTFDGGMESVYGGVYGAHHDTIRAALVETLANVELPLMQDEHSRVGVFQVFHFPPTREAQQEALRLLKQDEALTLQLALQERRRESEGVKGESLRGCVNGDVDVMKYFPYTFTNAQADALNAVLRDIVTDVPMQRLIHGEVGSGKTAVAFYAAMLAALNGKRTLILAPTTILAQQHYDTLKGMGWDDVAIVKADSCLGDVLPAHIMIGSHVILSHPTIAERSSLVIIDEFQKFGVEQRAKVQRYHPHLLLMSATPIPRSLAATVFGDLDVSTIRELPIKRGTVITKWVIE